MSGYNATLALKAEDRPPIMQSRLSDTETISIAPGDAAHDGEHAEQIAPPIPPAPVLAISFRCGELMARIAERKRRHAGYRDLEVRLIALRVEQLQAEFSLENQTRVKS